MSYILDALKKSDQQRQHAKAPTLLTTHTAPTASQTSRVAVNFWLALALIGIGLLIGWWRPWIEEAPVTVQLPNPIVTPPVAFVPPVFVPPVTLPQVPAVQALPPTASIADSVPVENHKNAAATTAPSPAPATVQPAPETPLLQQHELPPEVQQTLPAIMIAFHQYASQPGASRVMINNSVLHAGEAVAPGLKLEQITADGVVLSYQGYRFQRGVR